MVNNKKKIVSDIASEAGFSLLEVLVAIFVLIFALLGTLTLIEAVTTAGRVSSTELTAANLAQEGIELIRNFRDASYSAGSWSPWYNLFVDGATTCYSIQQNTDNLDTATSINCADESSVLKYYSDSGTYGYGNLAGFSDSGVDTSYKRKIILTKMSTDEIKVEAVMTWSEKGRAHTLTVEDRLWNWRPSPSP